MNTSDGQRVIDFAEKFCRISSGKGAGQLIRLRDWQKSLFRDLFRNRPRRAYIQMPRKNGKSQMAAILGLYGLVADNEPSALVVSAAADREQARLVFATARRMVETDPDLGKLVKTYRNELVVPSTDSRYRVVSADAHTKEGMNVSLALVDELHAHPSRDLYDVLSLSTGARENPLVLAITTPGARYDRFGRDTVAYTLYDYGRRQQRGEVADPDFFFRSWEPSSPGVAPHEVEAWYEANPALGDFLHLADLEAAVRITPEAEFRTKRLGLWTSAQSIWLPHGSWEACKALTPRSGTGVPTGPRNGLDGLTGASQGKPVVLALDGSFSEDATAVIGATVEPHPYVFVVAIWEKQPTDSESWRVDIADVEDTILQACKDYKVREVVCDPYRWQRSMAVLQNQGVPIVEYPQGNSRTIPAAQKFFEAVTSKTMRHDGNKILERHMGNTYTKATPLGPKVVKEYAKSQRRIDAAVAAIMAYDRATALGNQRPPQIAIW